MHSKGAELQKSISEIAWGRSVSLVIVGLHQSTGTVGCLRFGPIEKVVCFLRPQRAREGLAQPREWSEGDVSAEHGLQCVAGELAGVTRAR